MDDNDLPTSPRKKLKARHTKDSTMDDEPASNMSSASHIQQPARIETSDEQDRLDKEVQCGIVEYIGPHLPGFAGILKKRYTDFLVNEILPNGQVIHLDNLQKPSDHGQLSTTASKNPQEQHSRQANPLEEKPRPQFVSTNLNKVDETSRKRETVYMRHGADSLSLVDRNENLHGEGRAGSEALKPLGSDSKHSETGVSHLNEEQDAASTKESKIPPTRNAEPAESPCATQPGLTGTVGGWQAYAESNTNGEGLAKSSFQLSDVDKDLLASYFDSEVVDQILALFQRILASPQRKARDFGTVTTKPIEREVRTDIHQALRRIFSSRLDSTTDGDGAMVIAAANSKSNSGWKNNAGRNDRGSKPQQPKGKASWAELGGDYLHFTLYKENKDTMEVISYLAKILKLRPQLFQFAGTKDRRGITVQRASVYRTLAKRLADVGRTLRNAAIGNFEYHPQGLQLGDLTGNEFVITLRDCHFEGLGELDVDAKIEPASTVVGTAIKNFSEHGFINYYGLQRFGSFSTGTHTIGRSMLQGDFKAACEAILRFNPFVLAAAQQDPGQEDSNVSRDDMARALALHAFATTGRSQAALNQLPRKFSAEAGLIRHLARADQRNDYYGALQTISRNLRLMYVHAYQSLVWNTAASSRWKAHGNRVLPGDLVLVSEHPDPHTQTDNNISKVDQDGEPIVAAEPSDRAYTTDEIFTRARAVTESELASSGCKITIFDIVLPTPGYDILYPANDTANIYKEFMASEEGGGLDPYDMRRKWKDVSLSGSYRKLLAKPLGKVDWEIKAYGANGEDEQFVETDAEKLEKAKRGNRARNDKQVEEQMDTASEKEGVVADPAIGNGNTNEEGKSLTSTATTDSVDQEPRNDKIAVILKLQLGSSTYATMALRELMKQGGVKTWKAEYGGVR
ncbi:MAG: hypothetical protein Q9215_003590 [Flavoplaca cf. flavocitrina]